MLENLNGKNPKDKYFKNLIVQTVQMTVKLQYYFGNYYNKTFKASIKDYHQIRTLSAPLPNSTFGRSLARDVTVIVATIQYKQNENETTSLQINALWQFKLMTLYGDKAILTSTKL